jgi:hypothetical protein
VSARVLRLLFVAFVAATLVHIAVVMLHEPFAYDAWNIASDTHAEPFSFGRFFAYWGGQYTHSNPRVGQPLTYLAYKLVWFAPLVTPLAYLALAVALVALGTGRLPAWRRGSDLALVAIALGFAWFALPQIGMIMFCRAYGANYLYGAAIQLWFVVPLRLASTRTRTDEASWPACVAYALLGIVAGACNEHTGPTLCVIVAAYAAWRHREGVPSRLARAGALGAAVGFALIFFAPGQGERYDGLAERVSLAGRVAQRGFAGNLDIFHDFVIAVAPVLVLLVLALAIGASDQLTDEARAARRSALRLVALAVGAGTLITATIFVSPKLGARFYLHSAALALAGFLAVADAVLVTRRRLAPFVLLAVLAGGYAAARTVPLYLRLDRQSDERLAALAAAPPGSVFTADSYEQVEPSWWFLGDDFRDAKKRELITGYYDLAGVVFRGVDLDAPLGVSDVRLVPRYELAPPSCLDEYGGFELPPYRGLDVASIQKALRDAIAALHTRLPAGRELRRLDLEVQFTGAPPKLPRARVLVARWKPEGMEGWIGAIHRQGRATTREIVLPPELKATGSAVEIYIYQAGGEARRLGTAGDTELSYVPWKTGAYWVLACKPDECFVIAATRQAG